MLDRIALILVIIGAINWGSIGLFRYDIVAHLFGGQYAVGSRIIYTLVALAGLLVYHAFCSAGEIPPRYNGSCLMKKRRASRTVPRSSPLSCRKIRSPAVPPKSVLFL